MYHLIEGHVELPQRAPVAVGVDAHRMFSSDLLFFRDLRPGQLLYEEIIFLSITFEPEMIDG